MRNLLVAENSGFFVFIFIMLCFFVLGHFGLLGGGDRVGFDDVELSRLEEYGVLSGCGHRVGSNSSSCSLNYTEYFNNDEKIIQYLGGMGWVRTYQCDGCDYALQKNELLFVKHGDVVKVLN